MANKIIFFDTETTGLPKNYSAPLSDLENWPRLVQLAWLVYDDNGTRISGKDFIIKPTGFSIPNEVAALNGITTEMANNYGVDLLTVIKEFDKLLIDADYLVAHNMAFDEKIIGAEFLRLGLDNKLVNKRKICTQIQSTNFCAIAGKYGYKYPRLSELYFKLFSAFFDEAHNAANDVLATAKCFWKLKEKGIISIETVKSSKSQISTIDEAAMLEFFRDLESTEYDVFDLVPYRKGRKWGMSKSDKAIVIPCIYDKIGLFLVNGLVYVEQRNAERELKYGYLDKFGKDIIPLNYDYRGTMDSSIKDHFFSEGILCVMKYEEREAIVFDEDYGYPSLAKFYDYKFGYISENGNEITPCIYDNAYNFSEGLAAVKTIVDRENEYEGGWGFIDNSGRIVIPQIYDEVDDFKEGIARAEYKGLWGFIDRNGNQIIPFIYQHCDNFSSGLACVKSNDKYGFIDKSGRQVIPLKYDFAWSFYNGFANIMNNKKVGVVDQSCSEIVSCKYDNIGKCSENYLSVVLNKQQGFVDRFGTEKIPCIFESVWGFQSGIAMVLLNRKYGYVDMEGRQYWGNDAELLKFRHSSSDVNLIPFEMNGKWGYRNLQNEIVIQCSYDNADLFYGGRAMVGIGWKKGFIDASGEIIIPIEYERVHGNFSGGKIKVENYYNEWKVLGYIDINGTKFWDEGV